MAELSFPFPAHPPARMVKSLADRAFDPAVHLQIEPPTEVYLFPDFVKVPFPLTGEYKNRKIAASVPFRVLSDEGVKALVEISQAERQHAMRRTKERPEVRIPEAVRGLAYRSDFVRDYTAAKQINDLVSELRGNVVEPSTIPMNWGHVNFGKEKGEIVDQWHFDSVECVIVTLISEPPIKGGELEMLLVPRAEGVATLQKYDNKVPLELVKRIMFPAPGYTTFLVGSQVMHHVRRIEEAPHDRMTIVSSYNTADPYSVDPNNYRTFQAAEPDIASWEFTLHRSYRIAKQLMDVVKNTEHTENVEELIKVLTVPLAELQKTVQMLKGETETEEKMYFEEIEAESAKGGMMGAPFTATISATANR